MPNDTAARTIISTNTTTMLDDLTAVLAIDLVFVLSIQREQYTVVVTNVDLVVTPDSISVGHQKNSVIPSSWDIYESLLTLSVRIRFRQTIELIQNLVLRHPHPFTDAG